MNHNPVIASAREAIQTINIHGHRELRKLCLSHMLTGLLRHAVPRNDKKGNIKMKKILLSFLLLTLTFPAWADDAKESAFDRVMRTGVIRCGYYVYPPVTYRAPNTGALSGFSVDMMEEIAKRASLKVEWTEETNFSNWIPGLQTKRYDVACTPNWPDIPQGRVVMFSLPMLYTPIYPMVRADDERFSDDNNLAPLNSPDITFVAPEGDAFASLIPAHFPKAKLKLISADAENTTFVMELSTKKADASLADLNGLITFNENNPTKLKILGKSQPIKFQASTLAVERHELILNDFLNNAIIDLINDGDDGSSLKKMGAGARENFPSRCATGKNSIIFI
jgi:ABC-type amino acid transport substrate-binding protein